MGKWYVVEILEHKPQKLVSDSYVIDSCPIVNLRPLSDPASLKLLWTEEAGNVEYTFRIPDITKKKGYWRSMGSQNGKVSLILLHDELIMHLKFIALIRSLFLRRSIDTSIAKNEHINNNKMQKHIVFVEE